MPKESTTVSSYGESMAIENENSKQMALMKGPFCNRCQAETVRLGKSPVLTHTDAGVLALLCCLAPPRGPPPSPPPLHVKQLFGWMSTDVEV